MISAHLCKWQNLPYPLTIDWNTCKWFFFSQRDVMLEGLQGLYNKVLRSFSHCIGCVILFHDDWFRPHQDGAGATYVSNHKQFDCFVKILFRLTTNIASIIRITSLPWREYSAKVLTQGLVMQITFPRHHGIIITVTESSRDIMTSEIIPSIMWTHCQFMHLKAIVTTDRIINWLITAMSIKGDSVVTQQ